MTKKILGIIFLLLFLSGIIIFLFQFRETKRSVSSAVRAIPTASLVFLLETEHAHESWKKFSDTSAFWNELCRVKEVSRLDSLLDFFDSICFYDARLKEIFNSQPFFISAHVSSEKEIDFLFTFNTGLEGERSLGRISNEVFAELNKTVKTYDEAELHFFSKENDGKKSTPVFTYTNYKGIFIGSPNALLVEDAVRQLNSGKSLEGDPEFAKIAATSGAMADFHFYLHYKNLSRALSTLTKDNFSSFDQFGEWTALDVNVRPALVRLNGFTLSNDSLPRLLNCFRQQRPLEPHFLKIIPFSTLSFLHIGVSDFSAFYREFELFTDRTNREDMIDSLAKECKCDVKKHLLSWVENEVALIITENKSAFSDSSSTENFFAVLKNSSVEKAEKLLEEISEKRVMYEANSIPEEYEVRKLKITGAYPLLLGKLFSMIRGTYYTAIDEYIVFANDSLSLREFINEYQTEKTFSKKTNYLLFSETISAESNLFFYNEMDKSTGLFRRYLNTGMYSAIEKNHDVFRSVDAIAIQFSHDRGGLFYNNIFLSCDTSRKPETEADWETKLDAGVYAAPVFVTNHYTGLKEIFVQDESNTIYLIDNMGKILWKRSLPERIISGVFQVDALKNNKLQMMFNTSSFIFLVDRNGNDVSGFPKKLNAAATNGISVFDYEQNKKYRTLIACGDGKVYNYEINGMAVKGWEFPPAASVIKRPLKYFSLNGKDYLVAVEENGSVHVTERSGKPRIVMGNKLPLSANNDFFIEIGKSIEQTAIVASDSNGNLMRLYFNGKRGDTETGGFTKNHFFHYGDANNDGDADYIFMDEEKLTVFGRESFQAPLYSFSFDNPIKQPPQLFEVANCHGKLGIVDEVSEKIFLINEIGKAVDNFPLDGSTHFGMENSGKGNALFIVTGYRKSLKAYRIDSN